MLTASEVFTPTGIPIYSYVKRDSEDYELALHEALKTKNSIVSLSGPSKSGKTVLLRKVISQDDLIEVTGATIRSPEDLWLKVLVWCGGSIPSGTATTVGGSLAASGKAGGKIGIFGLAQSQAEAGVTGTGSFARQTSEQSPVDLLALVAREIADSGFVVFIDDFHYIPREQQSEIAKQIKAASERGIRIVLASVPHRSDDAVRANNELRGRLQAMNIETWKPSELTKIAEKGFRVMNASISKDVMKTIAIESYGSPQLMQAICLQTCVRMRLDDNSHKDDRFLDISPADLTAILQSTTARSDFRSLLEALHTGPRQRGTERKEFMLSDGSKGDVYRTILLALKAGEGALSLGYDEIIGRVRSVSGSDGPVGSSIQTSLRHMSEIASDERHRPAVLEWDEDRLDIVDPYFLFYLRHGTGLNNLRK